MSSDCACPRFTPRVRATRVCVSVSWCAVHFVTRLTPGSELCLVCSPRRHSIVSSTVLLPPRPVKNWVPRRSGRDEIDRAKAP